MQRKRLSCSDNYFGGGSARLGCYGTVAPSSGAYYCLLGDFTSLSCAYDGCGETVFDVRRLQKLRSCLDALRCLMMDVTVRSWLGRMGDVLGF